MSEKFTKGPWSVIQGNYPSMKVVSGPSFKINCVMWATDLTESDYEKRSADLSLIAAAPDMYALLKKIDIEGGLSLARHREIVGILAKARGEA